MLTFRLHAAHVYWCGKSVPSGSHIYKEPNKLPNLKFPIKPRAEINKRAYVHELIRMENCVYISTKLYLIANYCSLKCCQKGGQNPPPSLSKILRNFTATPPPPPFLFFFFFWGGGGAARRERPPPESATGESSRQSLCSD